MSKERKNDPDPDPEQEFIVNEINFDREEDDLDLDSAKKQFSKLEKELEKELEKSTEEEKEEVQTLIASAGMNKKRAEFYNYLQTPVKSSCEIEETPERQDINKSDQELINKITLFIFYYTMLYGAKSYADLINKLKTTRIELKLIYKVTKVAFRRTMRALDDIKMSPLKTTTFEDITNETIAELFLAQMSDVLHTIKKANIKLGGPEGLASEFDLGVLKQILSFIEAYNFNFTQILEVYSVLLRSYLTNLFKNFELKALIINNNVRSGCDKEGIKRVEQAGHSVWTFLPFKEFFKNPLISEYTKIIKAISYERGTLFFRFKVRAFDRMGVGAKSLARGVSSVVSAVRSTPAAVRERLTSTSRARVLPGPGGKRYTKKRKNRKKTKKRKLRKIKKGKKTNKFKNFK